MRRINSDGTHSYVRNGQVIGTLEIQDVFLPKVGISFTIDNATHIFVRREVDGDNVHHWVFNKAGTTVKLKVHETLPKLIANGTLILNPPTEQQ